MREGVVLLRAKPLILIEAEVQPIYKGGLGGAESKK